VPQQPVEVQKLVQGGKVLKSVDRLGGVFRPVVGKGQRPAYTCGPKVDGKAAADPDQLLLFQCPVSAIPGEVFDLLALWWSCRMTGLPPVAGGFLAQPEIVRRTFPIFEALMRGVETSRQANGPHQAAGLAVAAMTKVLMGGGR